MSLGSREPESNHEQGSLKALQKFVSGLRILDQAVNRLTAEEAVYLAASQERQPWSRHLRIFVVAVCMALIGWFFTVRIGLYFDWPPNVYRDSAVFNLTAA